MNALLTTDNNNNNNNNNNVDLIHIPWYIRTVYGVLYSEIPNTRYLNWIINVHERLLFIFNKWISTTDPIFLHLLITRHIDCYTASDDHLPSREPYPHFASAHWSSYQQTSASNELFRWVMAEFLALSARRRPAIWRSQYPVVFKTGSGEDRWSWRQAIWY